MKIFVAGPITTSMSEEGLYKGYEYSYVLESYYYVKTSIIKKQQDVIQYNQNSRQESIQTKESKT